MRFVIPPLDGRIIAAELVADLAGRRGPGGDGVMFGVWMSWRLLDDGPMPPFEGPRLVCWAGRPAAPLADDQPLGQADAAEEPIAYRLAAWNPAGWKALDAALDAVLPPLQTRGQRLCLRPRIGDVLSDIPGVLALWKRRSPENLELLLDPAALLAKTMLRHAEDHLERILAPMSVFPSLAGVVIRAAGPGVPAEAIEQAADRWLPADLPRLVEGVS